MKSKTAPNLYVLGAPRSGTSFLFSALGSHPDIHAPPVKEPHFHLREIWSCNGPERAEFTQPISEFLAGKRPSVWGGMLADIDAYDALYQPAAGKPWRLEGTPNYLAEGRRVADRIEAHSGDHPHAIAILRDPVERALSHYELFHRLGWEREDFATAMALGPERVARGWAGTWDYIRYSQYADVLVDWQTVMHDRFRVVSFEDLTWRPEEVLRDIESWLGLSPGVELKNLNFNAGGVNDLIKLDQAKAEILATGRIDIALERNIVSSAHQSQYAPPLVSVGMPVRNGAATIRAALDSLCAQTYPNLSITVCDNASEDETAAIVRDIARKDPRVHLKKFKNLVGIKDSYARAMATASGSYFLFAPADDTWEPTFVSAAVGRMQADPGIAVCCGRIELFDDQGQTRASPGVRRIRGSTARRWQQALLQSGDASRIYGLIRTSAKVRLFPAAAPEGWDHYSAAKLALHGSIETIDTLAMRRHQTEASCYRDKVFEQETSFWGQVFFMRHVVRLFREDPDFETKKLGARAALMGFMLLHTFIPLKGRRLGPLRASLKLVGKSFALCSRTLTR